MKVIYNNIIPFKGYRALNFFGILFLRRDVKQDECTINHESIHTHQMKELLYIFFYPWYGIEWLIRLLCYWNGHKAYRNISFEVEAYKYEKDFTYLQSRKKYDWIKYI